IGSMRAINTAQQNYSQRCNGFAPVLTELRTAGNFLSPDLTSAASVVKSGYTVTLTVGTGAANATQVAGCTASGTSYYASATPVPVGSTAPPSCATNALGTIGQVVPGVVVADPFAIAGNASPIQ